LQAFLLILFVVIKFVFLLKFAVMTTIELRNKVIHRIHQINNNETLYDIYRLLEIDADDSEIMKLSENHKKAIEEASSQIEKGEFLFHQQANKDIDEWLSE
jgi:hypothetical protein